MSETSDRSWIIDADSHVTESRDLWTSRVPSKYRESVPHVARDDEGNDVWLLEGVRIATVGANATAGWDDFPATRPPTFEDCHPAAYDSSARLRHLDAERVWAQVLFPNVAGFGAQKFLFIDDAELKYLCVRAYNDFLHEWASADARRLLPIAATPFWDIAATVQEVERCAELGFRGLLFTGEPMRFGLPPIGAHHWDPLWAAAQDAGLPIHFHVGGGEDTPNFYTSERFEHHGLDGATAFLTVDLLMKNGVQCADLITSGVLPRYPDLKFVSVESGIGWIPFVLETADYFFLNESTRWSKGDLLPSELFYRQVYATYWFEQMPTRALLHDLPVDNILFETDFPHGACLYGNVHETIETNLGSVEPEVRDKITWGNSAALYGVDVPELVG